MKNVFWKLSIVSMTVWFVASAQTFQGTLRGRIVDPNGSATASAKITLTDEGTGLSRATVTNDQGECTFASLTPATYTITVEAPGFKKLEQKGVVVATQAAVTLDLQLELGQVSEEVTVTSEAPPLQTADASTGQLGIAAEFRSQLIISFEKTDQGRSESYMANEPLERHYRDVLCGRIHTPQNDAVLAEAGRAAVTDVRQQATRERCAVTEVMPSA